MTVAHEENPEHAKNGYNSPANKKHDAFEQATLATAIIGVVVLIVYTGLTGYQAYIAKDTAERQLRAYISVVVEKHPDLNSVGPPEVTLIFKNVGQTPAFKVATRSIFSLANGNALTDSQAKEIYDQLLQMRRFESVMFPGQEYRQGAVPGIGLPFTNDQKILVSMGAMTLWVNGEVTYTDAFGYGHFTRFRLFMNGAAENRYNKLIWAEQGNDAD
jgi:hypothetical protein